MAFRNDLPPIIDAHAYLGEGVQMRQSVDDLLRAMDEASISFALVCPMDRYLAVANREGNAFILQAVRAHPDRLAGLAVANPWFDNAAVEEIRRALGEGLIGINIHSVLQGFRLSDHLIDPILEVAAAQTVPVYAHTGTAGIAEPLQLAELAHRFPTIPFLMGHAGSSDYYHDAVRALEFAPNLWLETSRNGPGVFAAHWQGRAVVERLVFGSSSPEYIPRLEIENLCDVFLDPEDRQRIFAQTIRKIFPGRLPA